MRNATSADCGPQRAESIQQRINVSLRRRRNDEVHSRNVRPLRRSNMASSDAHEKGCSDFLRVGVIAWQNDGAAQALHNSETAECPPGYAHAYAFHLERYDEFD